MGNPQMIERIPVWGIFLMSIGLVLLSVQAGFYMARLKKACEGQEADSAVGAVVGATLGLLAFMLAFTFGMAASRRESKRDLLLEEVNAIGTTYLRTGLIPEPHRAESRRLLRRYVELRLEVYEHPERITAALNESERIQREIWSHASALADADLKNPDIATLFVDSLNQMIDLQTKRVTIGRYRIPMVVWTAFGILTILSMTAVGFSFGKDGKRNWIVQVILASSFSIVVFLIADLDRAAEGWLRVSNQPMVELHRMMTRQP